MSFQIYIRGSLLLIWATIISGIFITATPKALLPWHLILGIGSYLPLTAFLMHHWWRRRKQIQGQPNAFWGYLLLICLLLLALSGLALLVWTNSQFLQRLHSGTSVCFVAILAWHFLWRIWTGAQAWFVRGKFILWHNRTLRYWLLSGSVALTLIISGSAGLNFMISPTNSMAAPIPLEHNQIIPGDLATGQTCYTCHTDIGVQWQQSSHALAAQNPYYQAVTALLIKERGVEAARFCASCHTPIGLLQGEIDLQSAIPPESKTMLTEPYTARALDLELFMSQPASEGITCVVCHQAIVVNSSPHNGSLAIVPGQPDLPSGALETLAFRINPGEHQKSEAIKRAELCGSCHNVYINEKPLEPTFDEWAASEYAAQGITCQDCHMPTASGRRVNSDLALTSVFHSDKGVAMPESLSGRTKNLALLQQAATIETTATINANGDIDIEVAVTNSGAGHYLPTGAADLHQIWLELTLTDATGQIFWHSGHLDAAGRLPSDSVLFTKVLGDAQGRAISLHRIWAATQILADTRLAPGETRPIAFHVPNPITTTPQSYMLTTRLLYRGVSPEFAEFALDQPVIDVPVYLMTSSQINIP